MSLTVTRRAGPVAALLACAAIAFAAARAAGDVIHLNDGTVLEGEITKTDDGWVVKDAAGNVRTVRPEQVKSFAAKRETTENAAANRLTTLRRSLENVDDVDKILQRLDEFVARHANTKAADDARADVKMWKERQAKRMVKVADKWVTPEQHGALRAEALAMAGDAAGLIGQGRLKEAGRVLEQSLAVDAKNPAALYLKGVMLQRQEQIVPSRKAYEASVAVLPDHAPTLNNLGVLLNRGDQVVLSLNYYLRAMVAAPGDQTILDNVAEALHALPEKHRNAATVKKVVQLFNEQDNELQARMAKRGRYRWGSGWVDDEQLAELERAEQEAKDKLDTLEDEYDGIQERVAEIDREIEDTERSIRRIVASRYGRDSSGRPIRLPYPRIYYELLEDMDKLRLDRAAEEKKVERLRARGKAVKAQLPAPRYTGVQKSFDVEDAPLIDLAEGQNAAPAAVPPAAAAADDVEAGGDEMPEDLQDLERELERARGLIAEEEGAGPDDALVEGGTDGGGGGPERDPKRKARRAPKAGAFDEDVAMPDLTRGLGDRRSALPEEPATNQK